MIPYFKIFAPSALLVLTATAQEKRDSEAITASLVLVGSNSDAYWVGNGPGIKAVAFDPDAAPPSTWTVRSRSRSIDLPCTLNRPTAALPVASGSLKIFSGRMEEGAVKPEPVADFTIPTEPGHYDIFLNRSPQRKTWEKPENMVLASSPTAFPNGSFRIINLHRETIFIKIDAARLEVPPRRFVVHILPTDTSERLISVQAVRSDGKEVDWVLRTGMRMDADQRVNVIFYPNRNPKSPCSATWYFQYNPEPLSKTKT